MLLIGWGVIKYLKGVDVFSTNNTYYAYYDQVGGIFKSRFMFSLNCSFFVVHFLRNGFKCLICQIVSDQNCLQVVIFYCFNGLGDLLADLHQLDQFFACFLFSFGKAQECCLGAVALPAAENAADTAAKALCDTPVPFQFCQPRLCIFLGIMSS